MKKPGNLNQESRLYVVMADRIGWYAVKNNSGDRCLLLFTREQAVSDFFAGSNDCDGMELHAMQLPLVEIISILEEESSRTEWVAIDAPTDFQSIAVRLDNFLDDLRAGMNPLSGLTGQDVDSPGTVHGKRWTPELN